MNSTIVLRRKALRRAVTPIIEQLESRQYMSSVVANFTDGSGTTLTDQFAGIAGGGWSGGWTTQTSGATLTGSVLSTTPLSSGGNYLKGVDTKTASNGLAAFSRQYGNVSGGVQLDQAHTISWDFRADDANLTNFTGANDRYQFFEATSATNTIGTNNNWIIGVFGANPGIGGTFTAKNFILVNGSTTSNLLSAAQGVDSGITLTVGTTYHISVTTDPETKTWSATITDGTSGAGHTFTSGTLNWKNYSSNPTTSGGYIHFSPAPDTTGETRTFSMDSVAVAPLLAAPTGFTGTFSLTGSPHVDLAWTDNESSETAYRILRKAPSDSTFSTLTSLAANSTSYSDSTANIVGTYTYRVDVVSAGGTAHSPEVTVIVSPDVSLGTTGSGWSGGWTSQTTKAASSGSMVSTSQLNSGGSYLQSTEVTNASANGTVAWTRQYNSVSGGLQTNDTHTISWDFRADDASLATFTGSNDRYQFFDATSASYTLGNDDSWMIGAFGASPGFGGTFTAKHFLLFDGSTAGVSGAGVHGIDSGITLTAGTIYHFTVVTDPLTRTWVATISDGSSGAGHSYTSSALKWRNYSTSPTAAGGYLHFGAGADTSAESRTFSLDNVAVAATTSSSATSLAANAVSPSQINLTWTDSGSTSPENYVLEKSTDGGVTYSLVSALGAGVLSYNATGLSASTTYNFRVRAYNADSTGYSNAVSIATQDEPAAPTGLTATAGAGLVANLAWTDNSSNETGFRVERSTDNVTFSLISTTLANATTLTNTGLTGGATYYYRVRGVAPDGSFGPLSSVATVTIPAKPNAASGVTATTASTSEIDLAWTDNSTNETGFAVMESTGGSAYTQITTVAADTTTAAITGLTAGTAYSFKIRAYNGVTAANDSNGATATTVPPAPSGLAAVQGTGRRVELSWTNVSGQNGYSVERSGDGGSTWSVIAATGRNSAAWSDQTAAEQTAYLYRVRAIALAGGLYSAYSSSASITTGLAAPTRLVTQAISGTQVRLTWVDNSSTETGYTILASSDGGASYHSIGTAAANAQSYTVADLDPGTAQMYEIQREGTEGAGAEVTSAGVEASTDATDDSHWYKVEFDGTLIHGEANLTATPSLDLRTSDSSHPDDWSNGYVWADSWIDAVNKTVYGTVTISDGSTYDFDSGNGANFKVGTADSIAATSTGNDLSTYVGDDQRLISVEDLYDDSDHDYDDDFIKLTITPGRWCGPCQGVVPAGETEQDDTAISSSAGVGWSAQTSWTNAGGGDASMGSGMSSSIPSLTRPGGDDSSIAIGGSSLHLSYFDLSSGSYSQAFGGQDTLTHGTGEFVLTDTSGTTTRFYDYSSSVAEALRGKFKSRTDASGNAATVISSNSAGQLTEVQLSDADSTLVESWLYTYATSGVNAGRLTSVVQRQTNGSGGWNSVRSVEYAYYDGTTTNGGVHDLESTTIKDGSGNVIDGTYYRYYVAGETGGYAHGLKYAFGAASYARLAQAVSDIDSASDATIAPYADQFMAYDALHRVVTKTSQGEGCSTCSGGQGTYTYTYATASNGTGYNAWVYKTVETMPDGNETIIYANSYGQTMLSVFKDTTTGDMQGTFHEFDSEGREILTANPSAVALPSSLSTIEAYSDLLHNVSGNYQYLSDSAGLINLTDYASSTTATDTAAGNVDGYEEDEKISQGETGTALLQSSMDYFSRTVTGSTIYVAADSTAYRNTDGSGGETTSYAYTWFSGTTQMASETVTAPTVTTTENGPNSADVTSSNFDTYGRTIWTKDGDGYLTYTAYDQATGGVLETVQDADPSLISGAPVTAPSRGSGLPTALNLVTSYLVDDQGRTTKETDPLGNVTYTLYDDADHETRTYRGWNATTGTTTGPIEVTREDRAGSYTETFTMSATPSHSGSSGSYVPTGTETISSLQSLTRTLTSSGGQVIESDQYFNLSGVTYSASTFHLGTSGTNYYATTYAYDQRGRLKRTQDPTGTITWQVYDGLGRVVSTWVGTNDTGAVNGNPTGSGAVGNNMVEVSSNVYDDGGAGDGNLTQTTQYPHDGSANRISNLYYDWRDREVATKAAVESSESTSDNTHFISYTDYDNLGEATASYVYDGDNVAVTTTSGVPDKPSSSLLRSEQTTAYDEQGRAYQTTTFSVDPSSGTVSSTGLVSNSFYDHRGNVIKQASTAQPVQKMIYDGAGRMITSYTTDGGGDASPGSSGAWSDAANVTGDTVLEQSETMYDAAGNAILSTTRQRFDNATATGALGDPSSSGSTAKARVSYEAMYYDAANRMTADVNVGTNPVSGTPTAYTLPGSAASRSDAALVTSYAYDAAGIVQDVTDPRGLVTRTSYDALGRTTKTIADYVDGTPSAADDQTTEYTYDGMNHVLTMTADLPSSAFQATEYIYGATSSRGDSVCSNDLLIATHFPNPSTGAANIDEQESYTSNALGEQMSKTDRNGNVHTFSYDVLGRQIGDIVTTLGGGVEGSVRRRETAFDSQGLAYLFTSYDSTSGGSVVNQVQDVFNGFDQLTTEYQATGGSVNTSTTPMVQYGYDTIAHCSRMSSMTYPNGRVLNYNYGTSSGLNDTISRLNSISDSSATLESYKYLGLNTVIERDHPQDGINLTYIGSGTGDGGDQYVGLDRFGRVDDQNWTNGSSSVDDDTYGYDRDGNTLYKNNTISSTNSELYTYDGLNRLTDMSRGTLNSGKTAISGTASRSQDWSLDAIGNSNSVTTDGVSLSRTTNSQNELTSIGGTSLTFDADGNETSDDIGKSLVYNAWNQLVEVKNGATSLIRYGFDALNHRDKDGNTSIYFSSGWQELEDRDASDNVGTQYVYSTIYIDSLVERDRDTDSDGTTDERLYVLQNNSSDVTAVATAAGFVAERYEYDPYGGRAVLTATWSTTADSLNVDMGYHGGKIDPTTGYINFRNRDLNTNQMRWMEPDLLGYINGANTYNYLGESPLINYDPLGLDYVPHPNFNLPIPDPEDIVDREQVEMYLNELNERTNYWWGVHEGTIIAPGNTAGSRDVLNKVRWDKKQWRGFKDRLANITLDANRLITWFSHHEKAKYSIPSGNTISDPNSSPVGEEIYQLYRPLAGRLGRAIVSGVVQQPLSAPEIADSADDGPTSMQKFRDRYNKNGQVKIDGRIETPVRERADAAAGLAVSGATSLAHGLNEFANGENNAVAMTIDGGAGCFHINLGGVPLNARDGKALLRDWIPELANSTALI